MNDQPNEAMMAAAARLQQQGEEKYGADVFSTMCTAVGATGVLPPQELQQVVSGGNALGNFTGAAQEALLKVMQTSNAADFKVADQAYRTIRRQQRDEYQANKGRR
jgi:hypothetical protein